jgi:hypothetical protein
VVLYNRDDSDGDGRSGKSFSNSSSAYLCCAFFIHLYTALACLLVDLYSRHPPADVCTLCWTDVVATLSRLPMLALLSSPKHIPIQRTATLPPLWTSLLL